MIEFNEHDTTLLSGDGELQGSFSIYSPSGNPIIELDIRNAAALGITSISCQGDKEPQRSTTLPSGGSWAIKGVEIANDATQKINCNYSGKIKK